VKPIEGYHLIKPEDLFWRPSNLMRIPNADYLERKTKPDMSLIYPVDPKQLPKELAGAEWPPET